ncbi:thioredoxin family protein [Paenibacillus filicis]|uniref:Thioredoxin family protein n=1 Tax=Paenibacillus filicis TaxID=669464 RepID=A0ABU9DTJ2_9BACL
MSKNLSSKLNKGLSPEQFIQAMTKNQDKFNEWYDAFTWANDEDKEFFESLNNRDDLRCLILSADWCGDVIRNVPVVLRALEISGIPTELLIKEEHPDVMEQFLTLGGEAIPIVIFTDFSGFVLGQWGPRPAHVQAVMTKFKQENPDREATDYQDNIKVAREEMGRQYGEGTGYQAVIVKELRDLISTF